MVSLISSPIAAIEAEDFSSPVRISPFVTANELPISLILSNISLLTSVVSISKAFIIDTRPVSASEVSMSGEILANMELIFAISSACSFVL